MGESPTTHRNQMKLFNAIAAAAVIGTSLIVIQPAIAGCYPALASTKIKQVVKGGGSVQQGWEVARQEGDWDGSELCTYRVRSFLN